MDGVGGMEWSGVVYRKLRFTIRVILEFISFNDDA